MIWLTWSMNKTPIRSPTIQMLMCVLNNKNYEIDVDSDPMLQNPKPQLNATHF